MQAAKHAEERAQLLSKGRAEEAARLKARMRPDSPDMQLLNEKMKGVTPLRKR
jgi:hypothetical protein